MYMKSGGGLGPAAPLCHGRCETDGVGGTDGEDSSELRQGQQSKPHSPCRAGPLLSKKTHGPKGAFRIQGLGGIHPVHSYNLNCTKESSSSTSHVPATLALSSYGIRAGRVPLGVP